MLFGEGCEVFRRKGPGGESGSLEYGGMRLEVYSLVLRPLDLFASWMLMGIGNLHTLSCTSVSHAHFTHSQLHRCEPRSLHTLSAAQVWATPTSHTLSCRYVSHAHSTHSQLQRCEPRPLHTLSAAQVWTTPTPHTLSCTDVSYSHSMPYLHDILSSLRDPPASFS